MQLSQLVLGHLPFFAKLLDGGLLLCLSHFEVSDEGLALLVLGLEKVQFMLKLKHLGLRSLPLLVELHLELPDLLLKSVGLLLVSRSLFPQLELFVPLIINVPLLDRIALQFLRPDVFLELSDLSLERFDHLLSSLENALGGILVAVHSVEFRLLLLGFELHLLSFLVETFQFEFSPLGV